MAAGHRSSLVSPVMKAGLLGLGQTHEARPKEHVGVQKNPSRSWVSDVGRRDKPIYMGWLLVSRAAAKTKPSNKVIGLGRDREPVQQAKKVAAEGSGLQARVKDRASILLACRLGQVWTRA
ncbi:hypothetical protein EV1_031896 [Malus domestica]